MNTLCIYHADCADGLMSAAIVKRALKDVSFHPGVYSEPPPVVSPGSTVYLVDFSYPKDVIEFIASVADKVIILDHHKTAEADLIGLPENVTAIFDMTQSGAGLTYSYFYPNETLPPNVAHVQDRDLWVYALEYTSEVSEALYSYPMQVDVWEGLIDKNTVDLINEGSILLRKKRKEIQSLLKRGVQTIRIAGIEVPAINASKDLASDLGHILSNGHPFAAVYFETKKEVEFSLRSRKVGGIDVSEIAKLYGGGGHKHASGFKLPLEGWRDLLEL